MNHFKGARKIKELDNSVLYLTSSKMNLPDEAITKLSTFLCFIIRVKSPSVEHLRRWQLVKKSEKQIILFIQNGADTSYYEPLPDVSEIHRFNDNEELTSMIVDVQKRADLA